MIERADVEHVARLARLHLSEEELERLRGELNAILEYVEKLSGLDTEGVESTSHAVPVLNVMRADEPGPCLSRDASLANAPDRAGDLFRVPRILED